MAEDLRMGAHSFPEAGLEVRRASHNRDDPQACRRMQLTV
jgi:hypothetical protein